MARFSSMKEALLYPARKCKLLAPFLLYAVIGFQITIKLLYIWPLTGEIGLHITEMEQQAHHSSAEYARLLEDVRQDATELLLINIAIALALLTLAFPKQILACFTTCSGGRCSLADLFHQAVNYAKGPLLAIAIVTMLQATSAALLAAYFDTISDSEVISVLCALFFVYFAFLWIGDAVTVIAAASVVDDVETVTGGGCRGVRRLREAWRIITQVRRKEGFVLVLVTLVLPTVLIPLYAVALLCMEQSTGLGLCLLSADRYNLVNNVLDTYYLMAACAYSFRGYYSLSMESKEVVVSTTHDDYAQIPSGEENI